MTTVNPVSSQNPETSRKPFNEFHFKVLNSFNLDEFKKFTNFPQLLAETIKKTLGSAPDRFSFESRIGHHFRRSISNEDKWRLGLFNGLKLTDEFYGSDTAKRIFKKSYGVRSCAVRVVRLPAESQSSADLEERLELSSDVDEENVAAKIDLTMSDESSPNIIDPRNMRVKYPRKQTQPKKSSPISGIDTYISPAKSVERIPMPHSMVGFDDETFVASSEPATTSSKRISIISNVVLVPPTPFRDETSRRQPDRRLHSSGRRVFKQEIGPKSKDHQRKVIYVEDETEMMPVEDAIKEKPKPKIGPKSKLMPTYQTTQDLLQDLTDTNPLPTLTIDESLTKETAAPPESSSKVTTPATKPRIGPKCVLLNRKQLQLPPKELLEKSVHTSSSIEPAVQKSSNVVFAMPKPKAGPKSRTRQLKSSSVDSNRNATKVTNPPKMVTITEPEPLQTAVTAHQSPQSDHSSKSPTVDEHSSNKTDKASLRRSQMVAKWTENMDTSEIPFQSCHVQTHENTSLVKCRTTSSETPTQPSDSLELSDINRSIERAQQYLPKYFATTDRNVRSIKHFWNDFLKSEFQEESSEAETQLIATPDDVELEVQSQAVLHPNQIDDNAEETRMEPQIDHTDEENVDEVRMEPQSSDDEMNVENVSSIKVEPQSPQVAQIDVKNVSYIPIEAPASVVDPHLVRCAEHSDVQQETKIKVELVECDPNETYSSDVQIIEIPPEEIIEILGDETQQLFDQLQVDRRDSEELVLPIVIPLRTSNTMSSVASSSKGFLTSLPVIASKKRNYQPLDIVVEPVQKHPPLDLLAFSQQHLTPPSYENYQIEECTMSESQHQRYALLNDENSIFLSSQLEHYAFNTGKTPDPKSVAVQIDCTSQPLALKRLSQGALDRQPNKRRRCDEVVKRELNWKIMDIRTIAFKPLGNNTFHLEFQLRNNYDTFHIQDEPSIKRILHLSNNEWKHIVRILSALRNGYRYDSAIAARTSDLPSRVMNCFVQSIPIFVRSNIQFKDFMGHCLEVSEQQPLRNECVDAAVNPLILRKMGELKRKLDKGG